MKTTLKNPTDKIVSFGWDGMPGQPRVGFDVGPGETVEVPTAYVLSGYMAKVAPSLVEGGSTAPKESRPESKVKPVAVAEGVAVAESEEVEKPKRRSPLKKD